MPDVIEMGWWDLVEGQFSTNLSENISIKIIIKLAFYSYAIIAFIEVLRSVVMDCMAKLCPQAIFSKSDLAAYGSISADDLTLTIQIVKKIMDPECSPYSCERPRYQPP